jgi:hypothetical protein
VNDDKNDKINKKKDNENKTQTNTHNISYRPFLGRINDDKICSFYFSSNDSIKNLKCKIYEKYNIPVHRQIFLFNGIEEKNEKKLIINCDYHHFSINYNSKR